MTKSNVLRHTSLNDTARNYYNINWITKTNFGSDWTISQFVAGSSENDRTMLVSTVETITETPKNRLFHTVKAMDLARRTGESSSVQ